MFGDMFGRYRRVLMALVVAGGLSGCALSPQNIDLEPVVDMNSPTVGLDGPVTVTVYDERLTPWLGHRGGIYGATNRIGIANNLQDSVAHAVEKALQEQGMVPGSSSAAPQFQVYIDSLSYKVPEGNYVTQVDLKAAIRVTVQAEGHKYQGSYSASESHKVVKAPSDAENTKMINSIVGKVLGRMFDDPGLMRFLARL
ncbi:YajG family lipoprotein [Sansalvadorimonas sp. 2012CJ34-2]|uniref:YajG family lipoprotein n=1 Tax=Parendozoicomonas callyspongiae TaxID=2942213 RepID=A0ABT0PG38_9GAMM|nr:YajG family lipoprotein [Sansalvadorimonas sp. 2012CJ34-2]MCL6270332.1 YajG family lipoprotein [Sansalvadorimonas sp. 2012CJ34-2]